LIDAVFFFFRAKLKVSEERNISLPMQMWADWQPVRRDRVELLRRPSQQEKIIARIIGRASVAKRSQDLVRSRSTSEDGEA
jgi:hypothetical protein